MHREQLTFSLDYTESVNLKQSKQTNNKTEIQI